MILGITAALAVFGTLICGLVARAFLHFIGSLDARSTDLYARTDRVATAWVCALAIVAVACVICVSIGYMVTYRL
jgi:hypothetical protein